MFPGSLTGHCLLILCRLWLTAKAEWSSAPSSRPSSLSLTPSSQSLSRILEQHMKQAAYSPPVGSGLMGSKEVEVLGRTELLSSEAEDCSSSVSNAAGWPSKSPLPLDSAAGTSHSGNSHRQTQQCHLPPAQRQLQRRLSPRWQCWPVSCTERSFPAFLQVHIWIYFLLINEPAGPASPLQVGTTH